MLTGFLRLQLLRFLATSVPLPTLGPGLELISTEHRSPGNQAAGGLCDVIMVLVQGVHCMELRRENEKIERPDKLRYLCYDRNVHYKIERIL